MEYAQTHHLTGKVVANNVAESFLFRRLFVTEALFNPGVQFAGDLSLQPSGPLFPSHGYRRAATHESVNSYSAKAQFSSVPHE